MTPLDTTKLIQFLVEQSKKDERVEAYQRLLTKIHNGDFYLTFPNSTQMIGPAKERFEQLAHKNWEWHSWYNGWMEGRFNLLGEFLK